MNIESRIISGVYLTTLIACSALASEEISNNQSSSLISSEINRNTGGDHHGGGGDHHGGGDYWHEPYPIYWGSNPWKHWPHPIFSRPVYDFSWSYISSIVCTSEDSNGIQYSVINNSYSGIIYKDIIEQIQDVALDRCYSESGEDTSCSLVGCSAYY